MQRVNEHQNVVGSLKKKKNSKSDNGVVFLVREDKDFLQKNGIHFNGMYVLP